MGAGGAPGPFVVVGAGAAGSRALKALASQGYPGQLHLVAAEPDGPYYRPALSKQLLSGAQNLGQVRRSLAVDPAVHRHGSAAVSLDLQGRVVTLQDGTDVGFDRLLIATGSVPRSVPGIQLGGRIGSVDDPTQVARVRGWLEGSGGRAEVLVIGAGLIGSEAASTLTAAGADVVVVDPSTTPLDKALGSYVDALCRDWHAEHGVRAHLGSFVVSLDQDDAGVEAVLDDGRTLRADYAVVAIGVRPATDWLLGSGLPLSASGAVEVDETLLVPGHRHIAAAGDVADWHSARLGRRARVEHWAVALEQGAAAAYNLTHDEPRPFDTVPMFWTEQHGRLVHFVGHREPDSQWVDVTESELPRGGRVVAAVSHGVETGYLLIQAPQLLRRYTQQAALWPPVAS
ncbi:FAD-dependent oxidoreductase [Intrasporangium mesophilum]